MKLTHAYHRAVPLACLAAMISAPVCWSDVTVLTSVDFEDGTIPKTTTTSPWHFGSQLGGEMTISTDTTQNHNGSHGSIVGKYPASPTGDMFLWAAYDVSKLNLSDVYVEWWAKMPAEKHGLKFMKLFGQRSKFNTLNSYANTTFGLDYTGVDYGGLYAVSFGDGSAPTNDTQNVIGYVSGTHKSAGRSSSTAVIDTPQNASWSSKNWDNNTWHHFRTHTKFNSGDSVDTEKPDGEYYLEIDGKVYLDAKGIFNRHYSNPPLSQISFFDWVQHNPAFEVWYDDIVISTGGFVGGTAVNPPKPPTLPKISNPK